MTATPDTWTEVYRLGITPEGGTEAQYAGRTSEISDITLADKDFEEIVMGNGARLVRNIPMATESITMKMYPTSTKLDGTGVAQLFHPQTTTDSSDPILVKNTTTRKKHKIVLLYAHSLPAAASTIPSAGPAMRMQVVNAWMTKYKPFMDENNTWGAEVTFKWPAFDSSSNENKREESTAGTALPAATTSVTSFT